MSVVKRGARAGVAAFALGLSLTGPQVAGIAAADTAESDSAAVTASDPAQSGTRPGPATKPRSSRPPHGQVQAGDSGRAGRLAPVVAPPAASTGETVSTPGAVGPRPVSRAGTRRPSTERPDGSAPNGVALQATEPASGSATAIQSPSNADATTVVPPVVPAAVSTALAPAATAVPATVPRAIAQYPRAITVQPPVLARPFATIGVSVNNFLGAAANWVSGLPGGPVTEFLEGALLLVRRALVNLFPALGAGQTTGQADVTGTDAYLTEAELNAYLLELAQQQYGGLFGQTVPVYGYGYGPGPHYLKAESDIGRPGRVSDTNTQVDGIDEADFVETDGQYIYVARDGRLQIVRTDLSVASESTLSGSVVGQFLSGDRLTIITQTGSGWYGPTMRMAYGYWGPWNPQTTVTVYDVADRTTPTVVNQTVFDGGYQSARAVDGVVFLVLSRSANLPAPQYTDTPVKTEVDPALEGQLDGEVHGLLAKPGRGDYQTVTGYRTYETWDQYVARVGDQMADLALPHAYSVDADGNLVDLGLVTGAGEIVRPHTSGQGSLMNVVSIDSHGSSGGFADSVGTMVSATGGTVYMTSGALYVATSEDRYTDSSSSTDTRIDRFVIAGTDVAWQASGVVTGTLINQFAMDERDGYLRVATHDSSSHWGSGTWVSKNDSGVYIFDTAGDSLDEIGRLTGLAPGEHLYAVRFVGDTAYLVTFLQTDPLFAIDLSDPAAPTLQGELVVPGFSNYLQSVGDGLLLGIGQEREAGTWNTRLHATLFDVSDGTNLIEIEREFLDPSLQWSWSDAQFDHHALLYSAEDGLLVVPVYGSGYDEQSGYRSEQFLKVLRVGPNGIDVVGEIHTDAPVLRTVRIGDVLYAITDTSVTAYRIGDLAEIGRTPTAAISRPMAAPAVV